MDPSPANRSPVEELIRQFPPELHIVVLSLGAAIGFFAVMGSLYYATYADTFDPFDLNGEITHGFNAPVIFSGGLLFSASGFALIEGRSDGLRSWAWIGIAGFFAFMGLDELATIHEHLQGWTGVDWQLLYLPVVAVGAVFWLAILGALSTAPLARLMWIGGVLAWFLAQVAEHFEFDRHGQAVGAGAALIVVEEIGEMIGSTLFLLAVLVFAHRASPER